MPAIETLIIVSYLAAAKPTGDVYSHQRYVEQPQSIADITTQVTLPVLRIDPASDNSPITSAFKDIGLNSEIGLALLAEAKEILKSVSYPVIQVVPVVAHDLEEGKTYLTLQLYVNADFDKALELDSLLTEGMVSAFPELPQKLSFVVYENEEMKA